MPGAGRIYVRLPNWVGDVVMAEPFLRLLREGFPRAEIEVHGKAHLFSFIRPGGYYDRELPLGTTKGLLGPLREGRRLARERPPFDLALLLPNSLSSALIAWAMGAQRRIGYRLNGRGWFLTQGLTVRKRGPLRYDSQGPIPMVDYYLGLAACLGLDTQSRRRCPTLPITAAASTQAELLFRARGVPSDAEVWAINPGGAWATKRWPPEAAADLATRVTAAGAWVLLLGGPDEKELARAIRERGPKSRIFGLPEDLVPLDILAAVLQRCRILVSTDSGPRHFGVAAGRPVLALVGPTHPGYTGIEYDASSILCAQVPCWPCHLSRCPNPEPDHHICMRRLTGHAAYDAALALLNVTDLSHLANRPASE